MKRLLTLALLTGSYLFCQAPPTYTLSGHANTRSFFTHPTSFYQFGFNANFVDSMTGDTGNMVWNNVLSFAPSGFSLPPLQAGNRKSKVLVDIAPAFPNPGSFSVEWQVLDVNGIYHVGFMNGTWHLGSSNRATFVVIDTLDTTVDSSTVAILD